MASYHKRKTKKGEVWGVRFRVIECGVEKHKNLSPFKTKREAQEAYRSFMQSYTPDYEQLPQGISYIYNDLLDRYITSKAHQMKESSRYELPNIFAAHITPYFDKRDIRSITKSELYLWVEQTWNKTYKRKNIELKYSYNFLSKIYDKLNNFLNYCKVILDIENKLDYVKRPRKIEAPKEIVFFEVAEFEEFIVNVDDIVYSTFFYFAFYTGLRLGEMQALAESDIIGNEVVVNKTYSRKTLDGSLFKITGTKNYKNYRKAMPKILIEKLTEYIKWKRDNNISSDYLFGGNKPLPEQTIRKKLDNFNKLKRITPHAFRHSYVSLLINVGCSTKTVAELIGDTEIQVIKTYSHIYKDEKNNAIALLDNMKCTKNVPSEKI